MSYARFLVRRAAVALASVYAVVSATFLLVLGPVNNELEERVAVARYCQSRPCGETTPPPEVVRESFVSARNLDVPVYERYVDWLANVATLDWGYSFAYGRPVVAVLDGRVQTTLGYVLPGVVLAVVAGVAVGLVAALSRDGAFDWVARLGAYALLGVPSFMLVTYVLFVATLPVDLLGVPVLTRHSIASLTVAAGLLAGQVRFSRAAALEQTGRSFVRMLRAKGASRLVMARHVLRNALVPIVSLSVTELLAVLVLGIYVVEEVLFIDGLAGASLRAAREGDLPLVIWTTLVISVLGITANFLQDMLYGYLDPRTTA